MSIKISHYILMPFALLLIVACNEDEKPSTISERDIEFVYEAGKRLEELIRMGNLATHRGERSEVQHFAKSKISFLSTCRRDLRGIAYMYEIPFPSEPRPKKQEIYQSLAGMYGFEFDSTYIHQQVKAHIEVQELFSQYTNSGSHDHIRNFALVNLSELNNHLESVQQLHERLYTW